MPRGRPERELDPAGGPIPVFAAQLRDLRAEAGRPSYRDLARKACYSRTALSEAAAGRELPSLSVTLAFVRACDGPNVSSKTRCTGQTPATATDLVTRYLTGKRVGIAGWAFDYPQSIFQQVGASSGLTNFTNFSCEGPGYTGKFGGDGRLLYTAFTTEGNAT
jgi:Helix-turn-helix domain